MRTGKVLSVLAAGVCLASALVGSAAAESKARIVRLSAVEGTVQINRTTGEGYEKAFLNLPVVEGSRLKTGKDGRAEVEFEDGSALRLGPDGEVAFTHLALGDDGQKLSSVQLVSGTAFASLRAKQGDQFQLNFGQEFITVPGAAHFRVVLDGGSHATVAVFKGALNVDGPVGKFDVAEKHSATIDLASTDAAKKDGVVIAKNYDQDPLDGWDRQQNDYHDRYASAAGSSFSSPYGYGVSDLNYYGNFMTIPGYGYGWQPFLVDAAWNPFMDGGWAWYPGAGYMWVSGYPWGWMPYYYGNWAFIPGYGWVWEPGYWNSWYPTPRAVNPPPKVNVPTAPASGHQLVMVGKGLGTSLALTSQRVTINPGSAGLGVPRGVSHLDRLSKTVARTSHPVVVSAPQPPPPAFSNSGFGSGSGTTMHGGTSGIAAPHHGSSSPSPHR